jgi:hypothetical protein
MNIATIGIDLAKNVFQLHGVDGRGKVVLRRQLHRGQMRDKTVRTVWAILAHDREYCPNYKSLPVAA